MYQRELFIYIGNFFYNYMNSKKNFVINEVNWNILVTLGKKIKRDSINNVSESRAAKKVKRFDSLN